MEWLTRHFTKERQLHSWEMLYVRIGAWSTLIGLVLYGLIIIAVLLYWIIRSRVLAVAFIHVEALPPLPAEQGRGDAHGDRQPRQTR